MRSHLILLVTSAVAVPLSKPWQVIPHWQIEALPDMVSKYPYLKQIQPSIQVQVGCAIHPAVNKAGVIGGGLSPTGPRDGKCNKSKGQAYVRKGPEYKGLTPWMFAWYSPKLEGPGLNPRGHRNRWDMAVVYLTAQSHEPVIMVISDGWQSGWHISRIWADNDRRPRLAKVYPGLSFEIKDAAPDSALQPLLEWDEIPSAAKHALNEFQWDIYEVYWPPHPDRKMYCPLSSHVFDIHMSNLAKLLDENL